MQRALNLVLAAWAGSLWTVCAIVAPSLFVVVADRHVAGEIAGYFFRLEAWLGVGFGSVALLLLARRDTGARRIDYGLVLATVFWPLVSELLLHPMMSAARAAAEMQRFGILHGVSALLFAVACISALLMVWRLGVPTVHVSGHSSVI